METDPGDVYLLCVTVFLNRACGSSVVKRVRIGTLPGLNGVVSRHCGTII